MPQITPTLNAKPKILALVISSTILSLSLTGCGSDSSSDNNDSTPPVATSGFTQQATWELTKLAQGTSTCYDFDMQTESACDGNTWDIKFDNETRSTKLWSNSGDSGQGAGGVFGLLEWSDLKGYKNATQDPITGTDISIHYNEDLSSGIFDKQPWFEYNLQENHQLYPNNRVYMITTNNSDAAVESSITQPIYAMQITNYYSATGASGYPTIRWIDTALPTQVHTQTINASNNNDWVYFDLKTGQPTTQNGPWQIGFKRNYVILNGGNSATGVNKGKVGGYLAKTPTGYYDNKGVLIASKFMTDNSNATLPDLTNTAAYDKPASASQWVIDTKGSNLNPAYTGNYPTLDYGWYTYNGLNHQLSAKPIDKSQGALIRSAEGNSYARMRLEKINYPNATATAATSWVFKFDIQPAPKP